MSNFLRRLTFRIWYLFDPPWDTGISPPELKDFIEKNPPGKAIDIGCGTGTNVITLAKAGWQVTGVDFVPRAIKTAKRKVKKAGISAELYVRDATSLEGITGPFDLALDIGCFHSLGDSKADYLSELDRVLAPGGHWLMYGFFNADQSGPFGSTQDRSGLAEADLGLVPASLTKVWRQDGTDRGDRASAWFLYRKTKPYKGYPMKHYAGHYYHIFNRGVDKRNIFANHDNYLFLLRKIKEYVNLYSLTVIAYCLMPNHYHLLLRLEKDGTLSSFIQRIFNSYVQAFNQQQGRSGTLFEGRAKIRLIYRNDYFLHIPRYIHLNPVKAGLVVKPEDWPYSNYREFIGLREGTLFSPDFVSRNFGSPNAYQAFVEEQIPIKAERFLQSLELEGN